MQRAICGAVAALLLPAHAWAECTKAEVQWLQGVGYTPAEAMGWCRGSAPPPRAEAAPQTPSFRQEPRPQPAAPKAAAAAPTEATRAGSTQDGHAGTSEKSEVNALSTFSTTSSKGTNLVTAHIATVYAPMFLGDRTLSNSPFNAVGLDISASLPADSVSLRDYAKQAIMRLDGGVVNIYGGFAGRKREAKAFKSFGKDNPNPRTLAFDHIYFDAGARGDQMLLFLKQGIGARAVKTALEGDSYAGVGTVYVGGGIDGPLLNRGTDQGTHAGWLSLEAFAMANAANKRTLTSLFGAPAPANHFYSAAAKFKIGLPGKFFLAAEYARAMGSYGKAHIGETTMLTFGYNNSDGK